MQDLEKLEAAEGFEVQLYSADPQIAKPIQMSFDAQGRLWVVSSESYPQLEPGAEPRDKVFVLEDADGDGKAETSRVFADGLMLPTGIEVGDGGVYVGQSTEVVHLKDTDGDGKADQRRIVLSGFGTEDTHHMVHTFRWGPGGNLHFAQSIYIHSHVETPRGVRRLNGGGFWLFRPDSMRLEVLVYGMVNSWGVAFDRYGQSFGVDNDSEESSIKYFLPGAKLKHTPGETLILPGIVMQKPKYCGAEIVSGRHFPPDWEGDLITCDFRAHRVCRYKMEDDGAGYRAKELEPLIRSTNIAFRPIDVKQGPDGALYICDWYNPIINHGEVDFRDPRRDKTRGRIWRVVAKDRPLVERPNLKEATIAELLHAQNSPEDWTRHFARRVLAEHPADQVAAIAQKWADDQSDELLKLRALWVLQTVDRPNQTLLQQTLAAKDPGVRAAAVRVLSYWLDRIDAPAVLLEPLVLDDHPRVRMEAVRTLARIPEADAIELALRALSKPTGLFLDYALKLTARETAPIWLSALEDRLPGASQEEVNRWLFALLAVDSDDAARPLLKLWRSKRVPADQENSVLAAVARHGDAQALRAILDELVQAQATADVRGRLLDALAQAHRLRGVKPAGDLATPLKPLLSNAEGPVRRQTLRLVSQWKLDEMRPAVEAIAQDEAAPPSLRREAVDGLRGLGGAASVHALTALAKQTKDDGLRNHAIAALVPLAAEQAAELATPILTNSKDPKSVRPLFEAFLSQRTGPPALAKALESATLDPAVAREGIQVASISGQVVPGFVKVLTKAGSLPEAPQELSPQQMARLVADVRSRGDAHRGEAIFRREKLNCVKCHTIKGVGGKVGPDLSTIGTSAPVDYLIESLLFPDKKIKENFHSTVVSTVEGTVITGIQVSKTEEELVLRDAEDKQISIPVRDIEEARVSNVSLMPAGLMDTVNPQEFVDLVRFLSELGKPGPFGPEEELVNRQWRLVGPYTESDAERVDAQFAEAKHCSSAMKGWRKSLTTFAGWTYLREFALKPELPVLYAAAAIEASSPGKAHFTLEPGTAATAWLNGETLTAINANENQATYEVVLKKGGNDLLVRIDLKSAPRFLKLTGFALDPEMTLRFPID